MTEDAIDWGAADCMYVADRLQKSVKIVSMENELDCRFYLELEASDSYLQSEL